MLIKKRKNYEYILISNRNITIEVRNFGNMNIFTFYKLSSYVGSLECSDNLTMDDVFFLNLNISKSGFEVCDAYLLVLK